MSEKTIYKPESDKDVQVKEKEENHLIVFNDDVHTFDYVIDALIEVCEHEPIQAEQCTYIIHFKGKCSVRSGSYNELRPRCEALLDRGLSATID